MSTEALPIWRETKTVSECWAASLGGCAGGMTREHLVTKGTFVDDEILVHGFDWCREAPVKIGLAGLTAKILCAKHNNGLSTVDDAGIETVKQFREFTRLGFARSDMRSRRWRVIRFTVNGFELERWFLKTLVNVALGRPYPAEPAERGWRPSPELVEIAFGLKRFQPRAGLYLVRGEIGDAVNPNHELQIMTLLDNDHRLAGAKFIFFGFAFVIYFESKGLAKDIQVFDAPSGKHNPATNLTYHPSGITFTTQHARLQGVRQRLSHVLQIEW